MIDGINVPVSMRADERGNYRPPPSGAGAGYWCGNAGANVPSHPSLQACTWRFNPTISGDARATMLRYVTPNGRVCTSDTECTAPELCGTSIASTGARVLRTCGRQIGWWTAHALCGATANTYGAPLECNAAVPGAAGTRANLFGCDGPYANSCYTPGATATCCGCAEWPYPSPEACRSHNPTWQSIVQPWAQFVKDACPTAYSYQFDDPTSTFKCQTTEGPNGTDYTITFCPGGLRGF